MSHPRRLLRIALVCALALGAASACGDDTAGSGGASGGFSDVSLDTLANDTARALCAQLELGCPLFDNELLLLAAGDSCVATLSAIYEAEVIPETRASIESGRQVFDATAARTCFERLTSACVDLGADEVCNRIFAGTVAEGGFCKEPLDCASGLYCDSGASSEVCAQSCQPVKGVGEACSNDDECDQGTSTQRGVCFYDATFNGTCKLLDRVSGAAEGATCAIDEAQNQYATCADGLACVDADSPNDTGTCQTPAAIGEPCSGSSVCAGQAVCALGACRALEIARQAGDACTDAEIGDTVTLCDPFQSLFCANGTCAQATPGAEGEPCAEEAINACQPGLYCASFEEQPICLRAAADGEQCNFSEQCASGACQDRVCVAQLSCP